VYGGGSADWAREFAGVRYSYLIELRDSGLHGFLLPRQNIVPTGAENWAGIQELASYIVRYQDKNSSIDAIVIHPTERQLTAPRDDCKVTHCALNSQNAVALENSTVERRKSYLHVKPSNLEQSHIWTTSRAASDMSTVTVLLISLLWGRPTIGFCIHELYFFKIRTT